MLTPLVLSLTLGAPVPPPPPPPAPGPVPRLLELKPDAAGKITVQVVRTKAQKIQIGRPVAGPGGAPPALETREIQVPEVVQVELDKVKDLVVTTADGKKVEPADALAKLKGGGTVVVSADGKPVSPTHLKLFKDDVLVLAAPELATATAGPVRPVRPLPLPPGGGIQIQPLPAVVPPGGIQIEVLPALPPAEKVPPKEEKK